MGPGDHPHGLTPPEGAGCSRNAPRRRASQQQMLGPGHARIVAQQATGDLRAPARAPVGHGSVARSRRSVGPACRTAEHRSLPADLEIEFRQPESVAGLGERLADDACHRRSRAHRRQCTGRDGPPRPTRPRSWCNCARPNRSAPSMRTRWRSGRRCRPRSPSSPRARRSPRREGASSPPALRRSSLRHERGPQRTLRRGRRAGVRPRPSRPWLRQFHLPRPADRSRTPESPGAARIGSRHRRPPARPPEPSGSRRARGRPAGRGSSTPPTRHTRSGPACGEWAWRSCRGYAPPVRSRRVPARRARAADPRRSGAVHRR